MAKTVEELVEACIVAAGAGADFPTIWHTILKRHPMVAGVPIQRMEGTLALLEVPLLSGRRIVVGPESTDYSITFGKSPNAAI